MAERPRVFSVPPDMPEKFIACHARRHWMEWIPVLEPSKDNVVDAWWRCVNCGTERYDQLDPTTLYVIRYRYKHPEGYKSRNGVVHPGTWKATYMQLVGVVSKRQASQVRRYHKETWEG